MITVGSGSGSGYAIHLESIFFFKLNQYIRKLEGCIFMVLSLYIYFLSAWSWSGIYNFRVRESVRFYHNHFFKGGLYVRTGEFRVLGPKEARSAQRAGHRRRDHDEPQQEQHDLSELPPCSSERNSLLIRYLVLSFYFQSFFVHCPRRKGIKFDEHWFILCNSAQT